MDLERYKEAYNDYEAAVWNEDWKAAVHALETMRETRPHNTCLEFIVPRLKAAELKVAQSERGLRGWWARHGLHARVVGL